MCTDNAAGRTDSSQLQDCQQGNNDNSLVRSTVLARAAQQKMSASITAQCALTMLQGAQIAANCSTVKKAARTPTRM